MEELPAGVCEKFSPVHGFVADSFGGVGLPCGGHLRLSSYGIARDVADALFWSPGLFGRASPLTSLYIFPLVSRYDRPVPIILKHSFIMAVGNLHVSVTVLVVYIAAAALTWFIPLLFPVFAALGAFVSSYLFRYVFSRYWQDQ